MGALPLAGIAAITCLALGMAIFAVLFARQVRADPDGLRFQRRMRTYLLLVVLLSALATLGTAEVDPYAAYAALTITAIAGWERQILVPITSKLRTAAATDPKAGKKADTATRMLAIVDTAQTAGAVLTCVRVFWSF